MAKLFRIGFILDLESHDWRTATGEAAAGPQKCMFNSAAPTEDESTKLPWISVPQELTEIDHSIRNTIPWITVPEFDEETTNSDNCSEDGDFLSRKLQDKLSTPCSTPRADKPQQKDEQSRAVGEKLSENQASYGCAAGCHDVRNADADTAPAGHDPPAPYSIPASELQIQELLGSGRTVQVFRGELRGRAVVTPTG